VVGSVAITLTRPTLQRPDGYSHRWNDPDGDTESYQYQWQKDTGGGWQDITGANANTLDSSNFEKDEQIKVICTPFDGIATGSPVEDTINISNSLPVLVVSLFLLTPLTPITT